MKKFTLLLSFVLIATFNSPGQIPLPPVAGDGSESNPYEIALLENLLWLSQNTTEWSAHFIQTADIDAINTQSMNGGAGFIPIGNSNSQFTGSYNGNGFHISNLYISRPTTDRIGLFGNTDGAILENIAIVNASITGAESVGGLVGVANNSIINSCYTKGSISSPSYYGRIGGLAGYVKSSTISNCYSFASVTGTRSGGTRTLGGLVGYIYTGEINNSYSTGLVSGGLEYVGGLVGYQVSSPANNCFWDTETSNQETSVAGTGKTTAEMQEQLLYYIAGWDFQNENINGTQNPWGFNANENGGYPFLSTQGLTHAENLIVSTQDVTQYIPSSSSATGNGTIYELGASAATDHGVCWNTTGTPTTADHTTNEGVPGSTGSYTTEMTGLTSSTVYYVRAYVINGNGTVYGNEVSFATVSASAPSAGDGSVSNPYEIANLENLVWLSENSNQWNQHFKQTADIDATPTAHINDGAGFTPIGNETTQFTGSYNGQNFTINGLYIDRPSIQDIGLFGYIKYATIENLGITQADITGEAHTGILAGRAYPSNTINQCFSTGKVVGFSSYTGGLVGWHAYGTMNLSYSSATVEGSSYTGGLVGYLQSTDLSNSYSAGSVSKNIQTSLITSAGGIAGGLNSTATLTHCYSSSIIGSANDRGGLVAVNSSGTVTSSFWDTEVSGISTSAAGEGKSSTEMKDFSTFYDAGWSFPDVWHIDESETSPDHDGYPTLAWQNFANINAPVVTTESPSDVTGSAATYHGSVDYPGGPAAFQHGFAWNTTGSPVISENITEEGAVTSAGTFTSSVSNLTAGQTYYIRSYATNSSGTVYGEEISFTPKVILTISGNFSVEDKTYDGTKSTVIAENNLALSGVETGDEVSLANVTVEFSSPDASSGLEVAITHAELSGADAGQYTLSLNASPTTTASIFPKELTLSGSFTASDKTYDGTNYAMLSQNNIILEGAVEGEDVSVNYLILTFAQKTVGENIPVSIEDFTIMGADANSNYVASTSGSPMSSADILKKELTISGSFTPAEKEYDGTKAAELQENNLVTDGVVYGDVISLSNIEAEFSQSGVGSQLTVSLINASLSGDNAASYTLSFNNAPVYSEGIIHTKELTVTPDNQTKVYGTVNPQLTFGYAGFVNGEGPDVLQTEPQPSATVDQTSGVGTYQDAITLSGGVADNYTFNYQTADFTVTAKGLTLSGSFSAKDKIYDGTKEAAISENNLVLDGVLENDDVVLGSIEAEFNQAEAGKDITVSLINATLGGNSAENYNLSLEGAPTTLADILSEYNLVIDITGNGSILVNGEIYEGEMSYVENDTIKLEAQPDADWTFSGWSGDLESNNVTESFVITEDMSIAAIFEVITGIDRQIHNDTRVWPNPFDRYINIQPSEKIHRIEIVSLTGRKILEISNVSNTIQTEDFNAGIYFIKLIDKNGEVRIHRVIKQD